MKINQNNSFFIKLAFNQAANNLGSTGPNPSVGCIVEKNGTVLSSGCTSINGRPHAEYNALNKKINFKNSNIYITLEPCSHYGLTPPCVNKIIRKKIKKVYFSVFDEDKRSKYLSVNKLKRKNIRVKTNIFNSYGKNFYKSYFYKKNNYLPYIDAKLAISKDYFSKNKYKKWITNKHSRKRAHLLRSSYDCVISTSKTINDDNSFLDCRIKGLEKKSPSVIIIDRNLNLKKNVKILKKIKNRKVIIFTNNFNRLKKKYFEKRGIKIFIFNKMETLNDFKNIFLKVKKLGYSRILIESGLTFINFALKGKFLENLYIFKANYKLKNNGINYSSPKIIKGLAFKKKINVNLFGDSLYKINLK